MKRKLSLIIGILIIIPIVLCSCVHEVKEISPSQTAFLIPLTGDTSKQSSFESEKYLKKNQVAGKRVVIYSEQVYGMTWMPTMKLIIVERKPETREWTSTSSTGTSKQNQAITAESKESIAFIARMNCSAQIDSDMAARFLYRYNNKPLNIVVDNDIRPKIESQFVEECSKMSINDILKNKQKIMESVRKKIIPYFKDYGVNITLLGLKGEFTYLNHKIQESIDEKFKSEQAVITQDNINKKVLSKAKADAEAIKTQSSTIQQTIKLKELENQSKAIDKWDGKVSKYNIANPMFNIPLK